MHTEPRAARLFLLASRSPRPGDRWRYPTSRSWGSYTCWISSRQNIDRYRSELMPSTGPIVSSSNILKFNPPILINVLEGQTIHDESVPISKAQLNAFRGIYKTGWDWNQKKELHSDPNLPNLSACHPWSSPLGHQWASLWYKPELFRDRLLYHRGPWGCRNILCDKIQIVFEVTCYKLSIVG